MIVRNEASVIDRCLASVLPFIDCWVIVDTGSTDGTQDRVRECLQSKPGELHETEWRNFGVNRNDALTRARHKADYLLFLDADETLRAPPGLDLSGLTADGYYLICEYAGIEYGRCALAATRLPWRWEGVVHEALMCSQPCEIATLQGPRIVVAHDGARSRDPRTYAVDIVALENALRSHPESARDVFYLAQSYRDDGQLEKSREVYRRRARMGGWEEEVWFSLYQAAMLDEHLGTAPESVSRGYLNVFQRRPTRAEPLVQLARYHRQRGEHALALLYARHAATIPRPKDLLFVEASAYRWRALDELSIAAYHIGAFDEGGVAIQRLLAENQFPESERERILRNRLFYSQRA